MHEQCLTSSFRGQLLGIRDRCNGGTEKITRRNFLICTLHPIWAEIAQSVYRHATGWTVRGLNPDAGENFRTCQDRPWDPPSLLYNGYRISFQGVKRPGRAVDHQPSFSTKVKEKVGLYLCCLSGPLWPVVG